MADSEEPRPWPDGRAARAWARGRRSFIDASGAVRTPRELSGLTGDARRARQAELTARGVPGAVPHTRISANGLAAVLDAVAGLYGLEGPYAWASAATLAPRAYCSERTVRVALGRLNELGIIVTVVWWDAATGSRLPSRHYFPALWPEPVPTAPVRAERIKVSGRWRYVPTVPDAPAASTFPANARL